VRFNNLKGFVAALALSRGFALYTVHNGVQPSNTAARYKPCRLFLIVRMLTFRRMFFGTKILISN